MDDLGIEGDAVQQGRPLLLASADMESRRIQVEGVELHVGVTGDGTDLVVLTGGPGCVQYLERDEISPARPPRLVSRAAWRRPLGRRLALHGAGDL